MIFARPDYLHLLWAVPFLALFFYRSFLVRRRRLETMVGTALPITLTGRAVIRVLCVIGFFLFGILAAARPQWGQKTETVHRRGIDLIIALDTSYSMGADDVVPNRLEKAKTAIKDLIKRSEGDRIGLIAFSGGAFVQCPLTLDYGAAYLFLEAAASGMIPEPGTSLSSAIRTATAAFVEKETKYKVLVLFTDGEDLKGGVDNAVREARKAGVVIYTVGIGSPEGIPLPVRSLDGGILDYRKRPDGKVVVSRLDENGLAEIAESTGGRYFRATASGAEIAAMYDDISRLEKKELESSIFRNYEDRFQYPLAIAVLFLVAGSWISESRRPWTGRQIGLLAVAAVMALPASASSRSAAAKNNDGNSYFAEGKYVDAERAYMEARERDPRRPELLYNLGNSLIRQKKYGPGIRALQQAIETGDDALKQKSWFNAGCALFLMGDYEASADAFIEALKLDPSDLDAKHNLEMALQAKQPASHKQESADSRPPQQTRFTREQAAQLLDAIQEQETEEQRRLIQRRVRPASNERDW
ncbi:MAG: VWA domain-containing protein [Acidobacteria bacterium]|mgnify:CR=1 FL=1|nr:VWA domain-containing protein [Acidobacteriota bacterium]